MSKKLALYSGDKKICDVEQSKPEFEKESDGWKKITDAYVKSINTTPTATSQDKEPPSASE